MCKSKIAIAIAIIAAMEREVAPLIRSWKMRTMEHGGRRYRLFENGEAVLVCGGIGAEAARRATEAVIREVNPARVISIGFAGAIDSSLQAGDIFEPRTVINTADGARTDVGSGEGILVSSAEIAGREQKIRLSKAYGASAVDMEAAAVAQGAQARGVEFGALKVVSDAADFNLPALDRFVAGDGTFRSARFACHVGLRPWLWGTTLVLARNSAKASHALCGALERYLAREARGFQTLAGRSASGISSSGSCMIHQKEIAQEGITPSDGTPVFAGAHTCSANEPHTHVKGKQ